MAITKSHSVNNSSKDNNDLIRGLKVNSLLIFFSGFAILVGSLLVFLLIVKNVYGNYTFSEIYPSKENIFVHNVEKKAALLYSTYTENMSDDGNTWVQDNLDTWMNFLKKFNVSYDILTDIDIEKGKHFNYELLVLAGAKSMSEKEISQIKRYADNGGSIFATGGVGTYSEEGKWKGWQFFTETFGMKFTREISEKDATSKVHTLRGNLPITAGIPTGYALRIATWDRPIYSEILEPRVKQVSYWFDYRREKGLVTEEIKKSAGMAFGNYGKGRFVWYGFEINSVIGKQRDHIYFGRLFQNCINWLTYQPTSFIKDWPAPYDAAAVLLPSFEESFTNINAVKRLLNQYNYPSAILVNSDLALSNPKMTKSLNQYAEIIPIIDFENKDSYNKDDNGLGNLETQINNIKNVTDSLSKLTNRKIDGVKAENSKYNQKTLKAMTIENISFLITDSLTDRSVPKKIVMNEKPVFLITKTARDDKQIIGQYGLKNLEYQKYTYKEDVDRILFEGGLYVMKFHNNLQFRDEYVTVIKDLVDYIRAKNIWFTTITNLVDWWKKQSGIELRYDTRSKRRIAVEVSNHEEYTTDKFIVQIFINKNVKDIEVTADMIHTPIPQFEFDSTKNVLYLYVDNLKADETRTFLVDFDNQDELNDNI
ncbi:hypothetical protein MNBD_IGNAVI01-262 [hydrothermal vent metagenome]|uniref:Beta-galactosidase trimerisation domain-containing protein n=1 Tax=hydrothermal vent metagenome TaxID=652676 RepID=A0A3B1CB89_9ZZZZ